MKEFYNNSMKMKLLDFKLSTYIDFDVDNNYKDSISNLGDYVIISKYMNIYGKVKNTAPWTYVINGQLQVHFIKKYLVQKINKEKREKLYLKWKGYDNSIGGWSDIKDTDIK